MFPKTKWISILFICYMFILLFFVVLKLNTPIFDRINSIKENREFGYWNYNFTPLQSIAPYFRSLGNSYANLNFFGNIIPFVPLGFFIPLITIRKGKKIVKNIAIILFIIVALESIQFFTMLGYLDIDDILLNFSGSFVGYVLLVLIKPNSYIRRLSQ